MMPTKAPTAGGSSGWTCPSSWILCIGTSAMSTFGNVVPSVGTLHASATTGGVAALLQNGAVAAAAANVGYAAAGGVGAAAIKAAKIDIITCRSITSTQLASLGIPAADCIPLTTHLRQAAA
eukprot:m.15352 g.15352  ORF g.15352 m.15352 type:complete len:122 (-) comp10450_c0_seq1:218-583(-)